MLFTNKFAFMQTVQLSANNGYYNYIDGTISIEKAHTLFTKFRKTYDPNTPRYKAFRERAKGHASFKLYAGTLPSPTEIKWVLLFTDGDNHPADEQIKRLSEKSQRLSYGAFILVKKPANKDGKASFTWQIEQSFFDGYKASIKAVIRSKNISKIEHHIDTLSKFLPGFSGIRKQKIELNAILKREIKKQGNALNDLKVKTIDNWTLRRIPQNFVTNVKVFAKNCEKHNRTVSEQMATYNRSKKKRVKS